MEKKEFSLMPSKKDKKVIAHKKTMNFAYHQSKINWKKIGIVALVLLIIAGLFVKFLIIDQLARKTDAQNRLDEKQYQLQLINIKMSKYNELKAEYDRFSYGRMDETEVGLVNRNDILDIIDDIIFPRSTVTSIEVDGNILKLNLYGITLEEASDIVSTMEKNENVADALVDYAKSEDGEEAVVNMTIYLRKPLEDSTDKGVE